MIKVTNIDKYFLKNKRSEVHVLKDITATFPENGLVILQGNSGSGKTTFLNVISGLDSVDKGTIQFEQYNIKKYNNTIWNKIRTEHIGYIFQNYYLLPNLSVFDNIAITLRMIGIIDEKAIEDRVHYILNTVGMYNFRKRKASQLSGGQKQRVAIARALVKNPKVVIADEPTGNLDSRNTIEIMNIIKKISLNRLVVLVTHEKELARFYGDQIINIKDGEIVKNGVNTPVDTYKMEHNDIFYLKDFKNIKQENNIKYYTDKDDIKLDDDVNVSLIYKNDILYLDVSGVIKKVKLITPETGIEVLDEAYKAQNKEDILKTAFEVSKLDHSNLEKKGTTIFNVVESGKESLLRVLKLSKVGKIMLAGFVFAGMITAISASILGNNLYNEEVFVEDNINYITFNKSEMNIPYTDIEAFGEGDEDFFINVYRTKDISVSVSSPRSIRTTYDLEGTLDIIEHIDETDIIYGRMPENVYEIVVDKRVYVNTNGIYSALTKYGIWNASQLLNEEVHVLNKTFTIVGISDTGLQKIFGSRSILNLLGYSPSKFSSRLYSYELISEQVVVTEGRMPIEGQNEVLAPSSYLDHILPPNPFYGGKYYMSGGLKISGTYDTSLVDLEYYPFITYDVDVEYYVYAYYVGQIDIYSSDPEALVAAYKEAGFTAEWPYASDVIKAESSSERLSPILYISVFIVLFSGLGIYYMMRSSMMSRMYSISVYRALGVKQSSIRNNFIVEIIILTTISSLVGFIIGSIIILDIQTKSTLTHLFYLNTPSILIGIGVIYTSNIFFGLLSISAQLRKTPSQLLSRYDM